MLPEVTETHRGVSAGARSIATPEGGAIFRRRSVAFEIGDEHSPGVLHAPVKVKRSLPQVVVKVDADGNEVAGVKSPLLAAPHRPAKKRRRDWSTPW